jgi:ABC-type branched-subunit amino acid transport system substrate-binding protein
MHRVARRGVTIILLAGLATLTVTATGSGATPRVRGFDGTTITLAGMGNLAHFPNVAVGADARIKRFNDNHEIKGVRLAFSEFADDKQDSATALSEARRLVSQEQVFALVGETSQVNPQDYFAQQHVPYFGLGADATYCSPTPTTKLWGFGYNGCLVASDPQVVPDAGANLLKYAKAKTGKAKPTLAIFGNDTESGKNSVTGQASAYAGAGFDVTYAKSPLPPPPVSDYSPYAQPLLTAGANGAAPDVIVCILTTDCLYMWGQLQANGYSGIYQSPLFTDILLKPLTGTVVSTFYTNLNENTAGVTQLKADVNAVKPGQNIDLSLVSSYLSTDMFIQALKTAAKGGKSAITPENVQKAAAKQTWQIPGLAGPTTYPQATVKAYPYCNSISADVDGTTWKSVVPYSCSKKTYPVQAKFRNP